MKNEEIRQKIIDFYATIKNNNNNNNGANNDNNNNNNNGLTQEEWEYLETKLLESGIDIRVTTAATTTELSKNDENSDKNENDKNEEIKISETKPDSEDNSASSSSSSEDKTADKEKKDEKDDDDDDEEGHLMVNDYAGMSTSPETAPHFFEQNYIDFLSNVEKFDELEEYIEKIIPKYELKLEKISNNNNNNNNLNSTNNTDSSGNNEIILGCDDILAINILDASFFGVGSELGRLKSGSELESSIKMILSKLYIQHGMSVMSQVSCDIDRSLLSIEYFEKAIKLNVNKRHVYSSYALFYEYTLFKLSSTMFLVKQSCNAFKKSDDNGDNNNGVIASDNFAKFLKIFSIENESTLEKICSLYHSAIASDAHVNVLKPMEILKFYPNAPRKGKEKDLEISKCVSTLRELMNDEKYEDMSDDRRKYIFKNLCFGYERNFMLILLNVFDFHFIFSKFLRDYYNLNFVNISLLHYQIGLKLLESIIELGQKSQDESIQMLLYIYAMKKREYNTIKIKYDAIKQNKLDLERKMKNSKENNNDGNAAMSFEDLLAYARTLNLYEHDSKSAIIYYDKCLDLNRNDWSVCIEYSMLVNKTDFKQDKEDTTTTIAKASMSDNDNDNKKEDETTTATTSTNEDILAKYKKADLIFKHGIELLYECDSEKEEIKNKYKLIHGITKQYTDAMIEHKREIMNIDEIFSYVINLCYSYCSPVENNNNGENLKLFKENVDKSGFWDLRLDYISFLLKYSQTETETTAENENKNNENDNNNNKSEQKAKENEDNNNNNNNNEKLVSDEIATALGGKCDQLLEECKEATLHIIVNKDSIYTRMEVQIANIIIHKICDAYSVANKDDEWQLLMDMLINKHNSRIEELRENNNDLTMAYFDLANAWYYKGYLYETGLIDYKLAKNCYKNAMDSCLNIKNIENDMKLYSLYCQYAMYISVYANCVRLDEKDLEKCEKLLKNAINIIDKNKEISEKENASARNCVLGMYQRYLKEKETGIGPTIDGNKQKLKELNRKSLTSMKTISSFAAPQ